MTVTLLVLCALTIAGLLFLLGIGKEERATQDSALGALAGFALLMVGIGVIASILGE